MHGKAIMGKVMKAVGLMSGTSLDGIDVAMIETDGEGLVVRGPAMTFPYEDAQRAVLRAALMDARGMASREARPGSLHDAERALTQWHADALCGFFKATGIAQATVDVVGFHGQTVLHRPDSGLTAQLGLGAQLADAVRIPVVFDLRAADVDGGGQGAPLVPVYHRALTARLPQRPIAFVNIGGVANVTWIGRGGALLAFDAGPGSALIDDWMLAQSGAAFDQDGATAARGTVNEDAIIALLSHPFFAAPPPKSLDRNAFATDAVRALSLEDGAATLAAFSARAITKAREHMPDEPELWIVAGGGRRNKTMMRMIAADVHHAVVPAEAVGLDGDSLEAEAWAYLAVRSLRGLALTFPGTTGVEKPTRGGVRADPAAPVSH
jgi:anhydro-N-acetylmuramic acid kinase